jgi:hypothetical protein
MVKKIYQILFFGVLFSIFSISCAKQDPLPTQGNVSGKITDTDDGNPLSGVTVSLSGNLGSYTTSSDGNFAFNDIVAGSYTITGVKTGYVSGSKTVTVVPERTVNGDFTMKKDLPASSVSEVVFNPQDITEEKSFTLTNTREGPMSFTIQTSKSWIKVNPSSGTIPSQNQFIIKISIDFEAIPYNTYNEFLIVNAGAASLQIPVNVTYSAPQYTVNITAGEGGEVDNLGGVLEQGTALTVNATPFNGYEFFRWSNGSTANPYTFTVTQSSNLSAQFRKKNFEVTTNIEGEGTIEQTVLTQSATSSYEFETKVKLEAIPENGWEFKEWKGDYAGTNNPIEVDVVEDKEYTAVFVRKQLDLIIEIEGEGTVQQEVVSSPSKYEFETVVKLIAVPESGWTFKEWKGAISSNLNPISLTVNEDKNIIVAFEQLDSDGDGVPDNSDNCPNSQPGVSVDSNGCEVEPETFLVESIELSQTSAEIDVGEDYTISYTVLPSNAANKNIELEIENTQIVEYVSGSKIRGKAPGTSKVFLKSTDGSDVTNFVTVSVNASDEDVRSMFNHTGTASKLGSFFRPPFQSTLYNFSSLDVIVMSFSVWVPESSLSFADYEKALEFDGTKILAGGILRAGENITFNTGYVLSFPPFARSSKYVWTIRYNDQTITLAGEF